MAIIDTLINASRIEFNAISSLDNPKRYFLLSNESNDDVNSFVSLYELIEGRVENYNEFRDQTRLRIGLNSSEIVIAIRECTDFSIDGYIFQVEERDKMPPNINQPYWTLFGTKTGELYLP